MDEKDKKFNLRKSFFESIKSAFNSKTNLKKNILKVGKDIEKNENSSEVNQNINILENIKRDFELEKDLLKKLADKSIKEIKEMYIAKIDKLEIKIEELKSENSTLREEKLLLIDKFEKELVKKDNIIKNIKIEKTNQLKESVKYKSKISENKTLKENLERTKIELNNLNKINKILEDDLNKVVKEKFYNSKEINNEIFELKRKLQRNQLLNNDLKNANKILTKKIIDSGNRTVKYIDNKQNMQNYNLNSLNEHNSDELKLSDSFRNRFIEWLKRTRNQSEAQQRRTYSDLKRIRDNLLRTKDIDIFNYKFNHLDEIINLKKEWTRNFNSIDYNSNLSSAFNRFFEFKKLESIVVNNNQANILEIQKNEPNLHNKDISTKNIYDPFISDMNFTIRVYHALARSGYKKLSDLEKLSDEDILNIRNMGDTGLKEIRDNIQNYYSFYKRYLQNENGEEDFKQVYKNYRFSENLDKELYNVNIKNSSNKILKPEIIKPVETKFTYSKEKALNERKKDQRIRSELAEIFKDPIEDNNESALIPDNNINLIDAKLKSALDLICTNINSDFEVDKSIFFEIAKHFNVTFNVLIDEINEHLYDKYDFLLIEIEDEIAYIDEECLSLLKKEIEND